MTDQKVASSLAEGQGMRGLRMSKRKPLTAQRITL